VRGDVGVGMALLTIGADQRATRNPQSESHGSWMPEFARKQILNESITRIRLFEAGAMPMHNRFLANCGLNLVVAARTGGAGAPARGAKRRPQPWGGSYLRGRNRPRPFRNERGRNRR
jgi:hypothetical protein